MSELITTAQAAQRLHLEPTTVTKWIREGKLQGVKVGRRYLISADQVSSYLELGFVAISNTSGIQVSAIADE